VEDLGRLHRRGDPRTEKEPWQLEKRMTWERNLQRRYSRHVFGEL